MRLSVLLSTLAMMFALAVLTLQTPRPRPMDAPADRFSASRAMVDVREIAKAPHPLGSTEHLRVRQYLAGRLSELGFSVSEQTGSLTVKAVQRLQKDGGAPEAAGFQAVNLIGIRKGRRADLPPLLLMAHYDTSVHSPGAADDSAGVAAILEAARALEARKDTQRDLIVLFTDAEEIGLEGARIFFEEHPAASKIGFIINLEARGGGGRAAMFETGRGDGPTIKAFAPLARSADGGIASTSLASFMYERMPNGTDFTVPRDQGAQGINIAFIGRARQYHTMESTPDNLDQGSLQHIGSQTLEMTSRLMQADTLPAKGDNRAYADVFGRVLISMPLWAGWGLLALSLAGLAYSVWRARVVTKLGPKQLLQGMLDGVWFISASLILCQALRLLAAPLSGSGQYYILLRRLPWMEASAALAVLSLAFILMSGARAQYRRILGYGLAGLTLLVNLVGESSPLMMGAGAVAAVLSLWPGAASRTLWGGWIGGVILAFILGLILQAMAPQAALIMIWPVVLAVAIMCITATFSPALSEMRGLIAPAVATIIGGAWLLGYGHLVFLGIGISLPGALGLVGFLVLLFVRPLVPARDDYWMTILAVMFLLVAMALSAGSRLAEPAQVSMLTEKTTRLSLQ